MQVHRWNPRKATCVVDNNGSSEDLAAAGGLLAHDCGRFVDEIHFFTFQPVLIARSGREERLRPVSFFLSDCLCSLACYLRKTFSYLLYKQALGPAKDLGVSDRG